MSSASASTDKKNVKDSVSVPRVEDPRHGSFVPKVVVQVGSYQQPGIFARYSTMSMSEAFGMQRRMVLRINSWLFAFHEKGGEERKGCVSAFPGFVDPEHKYLWTDVVVPDSMTVDLTTATQFTQVWYSQVPANEEMPFRIAADQHYVRGLLAFFKLDTSVVNDHMRLFVDDERNKFE